MRLRNPTIVTGPPSRVLTLAIGCYLALAGPIPIALAQSTLQKPGSAILNAALEPSVKPATRDALASDTGPIRVVVRSYETAAIGAEINARITRLPQREGDRFKQGDIIVEFDCRRVVAEHDGAAAMVKAHEATYDNQRQLLQYKAAGALAVDQAMHELEKARADVRGLAAKLSTCQILAPFDGRVTEKSAQVHEIAQPNQPLIKIINQEKLELVMMVPSNLMARVTAGTRFRVKLDENGELYEARIVQSTGLIDPVSQSARMIAELVNPHTNVTPGMSGTAIFSQGQDTK
jgi:membrane fusion protein, multidrug efflux system